MKELIEDIKSRRKIRIICDGKDFGTYEYNEERQRYEGFGFLTLESIKKILKRNFRIIKIRF